MGLFILLLVTSVISSGLIPGYMGDADRGDNVAGRNTLRSYPFYDILTQHLDEIHESRGRRKRSGGNGTATPSGPDGGGNTTIVFIAITPGPDLEVPTTTGVNGTTPSGPDGGGNTTIVGIAAITPGPYLEVPTTIGGNGTSEPDVVVFTANYIGPTQEPDG